MNFLSRLRGRAAEARHWFASNMNDRLIVCAASLILACCFLIIILTTRSELLILIAGTVFGALGTWVHIRRSSSRIRLFHAVVFGALIGAFGWLLAGLAQISLVLLMGQPQVAFAPNSLVLFAVGLTLLSLLAGLGGMASSFLSSRPR